MKATETTKPAEASTPVETAKGADAGAEPNGADELRECDATEAPGQPVSLADDLAGELKEGKTSVRGIDWVSGSAEISPAGRSTKAWQRWARP